MKKNRIIIGLAFIFVSSLPVMAQNGSGITGFQTVVDIVLFLVAACAAVFAFFLRRDFVAHRQAASDEISALKLALKKRQEEMQQRMDSLTVQIDELRKQQMVSRETKPTPAAKPAVPKRDTYPKQLYLSRPDDKGVFLAVTAAFEPGNSLFVLTTPDGRTGTFSVVDDADVHQLALMMPTENLTRACTGNNIQVSGGMRRIVTEEPGRAVCENGAWRVTTQARIRYES